MKRRLTARDRDIADFLSKLPIGDHAVIVRPDGLARVKAEGSVSWHIDDRIVTIITVRP